VVLRDRERRAGELAARDVSTTTWKVCDPRFTGAE
jgi:hypothetical protein